MKSDYHRMDPEDSQFLNDSIDRGVNWRNGYEKKSHRHSPSGYAWEFNKGPEKFFRKPKKHKKTLRDHRKN